MKRTLIILAIAAIAAPWSLVADEVLSRNAVGYVKVTCNKGEFALVSLNFDSLSGADVFCSDVIGEQLPVGSRAYIWNSVSNQYDIESRGGRSGWADVYPINPSVGFWLEVPDTAVSNTYDVYMMGEVPSIGTNTVSMPSNLNCVSYYYPVSTLWTGTQIAIDLPAGSRLYLWSGTNYDIYAKGGRSGWSGAETLMIEPGQGFWVENAGTPIDWDQVRPYTWPHD